VAHLLQRVDADALDAAIGARRTAREPGGPVRRQMVVDGKTVCGSRRAAEASRDLVRSCQVEDEGGDGCGR
jgi:hypothetical protein